MAKVILFDLECSNLSASFGRILSFGWKELNESSAHVKSIHQFKAFRKDPTEDLDIVKFAYETLKDADAVIGWYSSRFDWPFLQSRLLYHRLPVLPPTAHIDLWKTSRYCMRMHSNRLAAVSEFLGLAQKTPLMGPQWVRGAAGHIPSLRYIAAHCVRDVEVLEQAYLVMRPLVEKHPNIALLNNASKACPACGKLKLQRRGISATKSNKYYRYQCTNCGSWTRGERIRMELTTS